MLPFVIKQKSISSVRKTIVSKFSINMILFPTYHRKNAVKIDVEKILHDS